MTEELWCVEWSHSQCCLHVQPVKEAMDDNLLAALAGNSSDWLMIFVGTEDKCRDFAGEQQIVIDARREMRAQGVRRLS